MLLTIYLSPTKNSCWFTCPWRFNMVLIRIHRKDRIAAEREYKKKKAQKKAQRQKVLEEEREGEKNKWLDFNAKVCILLLFPNDWLLLNLSLSFVTGFLKDKQRSCQEEHLCHTWFSPGPGWSGHLRCLREAYDPVCRQRQVEEIEFLSCVYFEWLFCIVWLMSVLCPFLFCHLRWYLQVMQILRDFHLSSLLCWRVFISYGSVLSRM